MTLRHVVLRSYLAEQLVSENESDLKNSRQILTYVPGICFLYGFPNVMLTRIQDPIEEFLYQAAHNIFSTYFSSRSGFRMSTISLIIKRCLLRRLRRLGEIVLRRRKYRISEDDLDSFLDRH